MSESKHTPGPWRHAGRGVIVQDGSKYRMAGTVAIVTDGDHPSAIADARLIAAAPDLLSAAREALEVLGLHPPLPSVIDAWERLRAAIERAGGGE